MIQNFLADSIFIDAYKRGTVRGENKVARKTLHSKKKRFELQLENGTERKRAFRLMKPSKSMESIYIYENPIINLSMI